MFTTPVLFLVFNRPEPTKKVFEQIRKIQPASLYIAADGPRPDKPGEDKICAEVKNIILSNIDWDCEVKTLFREHNMGCGKAVSEAITWFFEDVEEGIILEDDCLPDLSFFSFCENLLKKYADDERIFIITGTNLSVELRNLKSSYVFSNYAGIWGWATWKRAWNKYDYAMENWEQESNQLIVSRFFENKNELEFYREKFANTFLNIDVTTWDYQWFYTRIIHGALGIIPAKNLISNIGFADTATHTFDPFAKEANLKTFKISKNLIHPSSIGIDDVFENVFMCPPEIRKKNIYLHSKQTLLKMCKMLFNKLNLK
jgi:hypothetical protein